MFTVRKRNSRKAVKGCGHKNLYSFGHTVTQAPSERALRDKV